MLTAGWCHIYQRDCRGSPDSGGSTRSPPTWSGPRAASRLDRPEARGPGDCGELASACWPLALPGHSS